MIKIGQSKGRGVLMKYSKNIEEKHLLGLCEGSFPHLSATTMGNGMMNKGGGAVSLGSIFYLIKEREGVK